MPPQKITSPGFGPYGRYILDVNARKLAIQEHTSVYFHDSTNITGACGINGISTGDISRFDSDSWAVQRGFVKCSHCFGVV